jgi:hypothetical protein
VGPLRVRGGCRDSVLPQLAADLLQAQVGRVGPIVPGYEASYWNGIGAPKATPAEIIEKLNKEINASLADPKLIPRLIELGAEPMPLSSGDFGRLIADEPRSGAR